MRIQDTPKFASRYIASSTSFPDIPVPEKKRVPFSTLADLTNEHLLRLSICGSLRPWISGKKELSAPTSPNQALNWGAS